MLQVTVDLELLEVERYLNKSFSASFIYEHEAKPNVSVVAKNSFGQSRAAISTLRTHNKTDRKKRSPDNTDYANKSENIFLRTNNKTDRKKRSPDDTDYANKSENILLPVWLAQLFNCFNGCLCVCMRDNQTSPG